ncbi:uncharacterized protein ARMOST_21535 [Armillaria ostoyae]|uniref:Uncharacterized protein n=1 Tax=Armillaria ostoyae TaxID=47428 RepID=A0A284SAD4_ARMOS|nr:uncharacterized protein ARMOST_21535 [Armillaria ostoyae]
MANTALKKCSISNFLSINSIEGSTYAVFSMEAIDDIVIAFSPAQRQGGIHLL